MLRRRDVSNAICDAIEASYYVAPESPGLTPDELVAVLADLGFKPGEIADALRYELRSRVGWGRQGLRFLPEQLPVYLYEYIVRFEGDPRDWDAFAFMQESLQTLARERGLAKAKMSISELILEGEKRGFERHHLVLAVYGLPLAGFAHLDEANNVIELTQKGSNWTLLNQPSSMRLASRPDFAKILAGVRREHAKRDPSVRWRVLRDSIVALSEGVTLSIDEATVLDDIVAHFADTGEPISLDDVLRRLPDLEVRFIANTRLKDKNQLHARPDTSVVPSLLALRRHPDFFGPLFLLANDVLANSKALWDRKEQTVDLTGVNGLIKPGRPGTPTSVESKQFRLLLESMSFTPCLVPSSPGRIEIRDEIRSLATITRLLEFKLRPPQRPASVATAAPPTREESLIAKPATDGSATADIIVVCALPTPELEFAKKACPGIWEEVATTHADPSTYYQTTLSRESRRSLRVIAAAPNHMGLVASAVLATKMIVRFQPRLVAMVGIAAGARTDKQDFGDILAAEHTFDYRSGKLNDGRFEPDPKPVEVNARLLGRLNHWRVAEQPKLDEIKQSWPGDKPKTSLSLHIGPLGSGGSVVATATAIEEIRDSWRKLIGIEMEAYAVHRACQDAIEPAPMFLCLKSVCDFGDSNKDDRWQHYAAYTAATFFWQFIAAEWDRLFPSDA